MLRRTNNSSPHPGVVETAIVIILSGMEISYYVDHPVYRYRDIEKLGRICKTEGSWTKTWPLEQLCTMCAPLVRLSSPILFPSNDRTLSRSLFISRPRASLACHSNSFRPASTSFPDRD